MNGPRYAIYFVPAADSALYRFGASVLGYDCYAGADVPLLSQGVIGGPEWWPLVQSARRYGFHATLKAPFHLRASHGEDELRAAVSEMAERLPAIEHCPLRPQRIGGFAALVPAVSLPDIGMLADACVRAFDDFRMPLSPAERERRLRAAPLAASQQDHLDRWGYPYVFADFRFHMTLTDRLPEEQGAEVLSGLDKAFSRAVPAHEARIDALTLLRQDRADSPFRVIHTAPLGAGLIHPSVIRPC